MEEDRAKIRTEQLWLLLHGHFPISTSPPPPFSLDTLFVVVGQSQLLLCFCLSDTPLQVCGLHWYAVPLLNLLLPLSLLGPLASHFLRKLFVQPGTVCSGAFRISLFTKFRSSVLTTKWDLLVL